jgi:hypothetical protein
VDPVLGRLGPAELTYPKCVNGRQSGDAYGWQLPGGSAAAGAS